MHDMSTPTSPLPLIIQANPHRTADLRSFPEGRVLVYGVGINIGGDLRRAAHDRHHDQPKQPEGCDLLHHHERHASRDDAVEELRVSRRPGAGVQGAPPFPSRLRTRRA